MPELRSPDEVPTVTDDSLPTWAAQALAPTYPHPGGRGWRLGDAVALYAPALNQRDRIVVHGHGSDVAKLLQQPEPVELLERGAFVIAYAALAEQLVDLLPLAREVARFGWMTTATPPAPPSWPVGWQQPGSRAEIDELLERASPHSWVTPENPGAKRWAGIRSGDGSLLAVAADAWRAPTVGFLAGVATDPAHRGSGLATAVCAFATRELLTQHPCVSLMVDRDNAAAIAAYRKLGFDYRTVSALAASGE